MGVVKRLREQRRAEKDNFNMREYIQFHLDLYNLGKLVKVDGPHRGGSSRDQGYYELGVIYLPPGNEHRDDVQFYQKRVNVYLGYSTKGGYWNRRNIRVALELHAKEIVREAAVVEETHRVWHSAQTPLQLTSGRNSSGAFEL